jgi:UDP-glucose 4-epimerase
VENLADLMLACLVRPAAANQTFLVSDGEDLSTTELLRRVARAFGRRALLVPIPTRLLRGLAGIARRGDAADRLFGNLQVDIEKTRRVLGWSPPVDVDTALSKTARYFLETRFAITS